MKPGISIVIEVVGNGWLVRPLHLTPEMDYSVMGYGAVQVFNDLGVAVPTQDSAQSLTSFIEAHFKPKGEPDESL